MGSPMLTPPLPIGSSLPASDLASTNSTQEVDTQYLRDLLGTRLGVSTTLDSEMIGMIPYNVLYCTRFYFHRYGDASLRTISQLMCYWSAEPSS